MKKVLLLIMASAMFLCTVEAKRKVKPFYGSKADIIGISGDADSLIAGEYSNKFFKNDVRFDNIEIIQTDKGEIDGLALAQELNNRKAGLAILRFILDDGNGNISFERLDQRSMKNVSEAEAEVAEADENLSKEDILKANVAPQFSKNYIYFQRDSKTKVKNAWCVLHVEMDESTFEQVWNICLENGAMNGEKVSISKLDVIDPQVTLVGTGLSKKDDFELKGYALRDIGKKIPDFAIRGQVSRKYSKAFPNSLTASMGTTDGVKKNDMVYFYRSKVENINGQPVNVSNKLGAGRVIKLTDNEAKLLGVSGGWANEKKGDVAVLHQDKKQSSNIMFDYQNKSVGVSYQHDFLLGLTSSGLGHDLFIRFGVSYLLPSESKLKEKAGYDKTTGTAEELGYVPTEYVPANAEYGYDAEGNTYMRYFDNFKKPMLFHLGFGYGPTWKIAHMLDLMPYVMAEGEVLWGINQKTFDVSANADSQRYPTYLAVSIRGKGGVKLSINLDKMNRYQFFVGAEYNFVNFGINEYTSTEGATSNKRIEIYPYDWWEDGVAKANKIRRTGLDIYTGIRINF